MLPGKREFILLPVIIVVISFPVATETKLRIKNIYLGSRGTSGSSRFGGGEGGYSIVVGEQSFMLKLIAVPSYSLHFGFILLGKSS